MSQRITVFVKIDLELQNALSEFAVNAMRLIMLNHQAYLICAHLDVCVYMNVFSWICFLAYNRSLDHSDQEQCETIGSSVEQ